MKVQKYLIASNKTHRILRHNPQNNILIREFSNISAKEKLNFSYEGKTAEPTLLPLSMREKT